MRLSLKRHCEKIIVHTCQKLVICSIVNLKVFLHKYYVFAKKFNYLYGSVIQIVFFFN